MTTKKFSIALLLTVALLAGWIARTEYTPHSPDSGSYATKADVNAIDTSITSLAKDVSTLQHEITSLQSVAACLEQPSFVEGNVALNHCNLVSP